MWSGKAGRSRCGKLRFVTAGRGGRGLFWNVKLGFSQLRRVLERRVATVGAGCGAARYGGAGQGGLGRLWRGKAGRCVAVKDWRSRCGSSGPV